MPRKGLQKPSVRTIFFRASYTLLYWALGSGCRLCILVCNRAQPGERLQLPALNAAPTNHRLKLKTQDPAPLDG